MIRVRAHPGPSTEVSAATARPVRDFGNVAGPVLGGEAATRDGASVGSRVRAEVIERRVVPRSEEHTSELQPRQYLVCRLLLEKKNNIHNTPLLNSSPPSILCS